jgi:hypothetical protein
MIIWNPLTVSNITKPNAVNISISALDDTTPTPIILNWYSVINISANFPESILINASASGVILSGDTSLSFGNSQQMDYANSDGTLGTAYKIIDIPKTSYLYNYHVDPRISETYTFTVNCFSLIGTVFNSLVDVIASSNTYELTVLNSWTMNKTNILNILSKNY